MGAEERARQRIGQAVTESLAIDLERTARRVTVTQQAMNRQAEAIELMASTMSALYRDYEILRARVDELELSRWAKLLRYVHGVLEHARGQSHRQMLQDAGYDVDKIREASGEGVIVDGQEQEGREERQEGLLTEQPAANRREVQPPAESLEETNEQAAAPPAESFAQMREKYRGPRGVLH